MTTASGSTGPSLVYLDTGGKAVAYHGLLEQVRCMGHEQVGRASAVSFVAVDASLGVVVCCCW